MRNTVNPSGSDNSPADPDVDIVLAMAEGDTQAFGQLMTRHIDKLKSLAWHMLGDEMRAEDVTQDVFLTAWQQAPNWRCGEAKYSTWLYRITKNKCYDVLRKRNEIYSDQPPEMVDERANADEILQADEQEALRNQRVRDAINALPERQKMAIILFHFDQTPQKQAAEIMEITVKAYESLLARARKSLHDRLGTQKEELMTGLRRTP